VVVKRILWVYPKVSHAYQEYPRRVYAHCLLASLILPRQLRLS